MVEAAGDGGSTCSTPPAATSSRCCDPLAVEAALAKVPLRVHQDIVVSSQMLVDPGDTVVLLPAATRYEQRDGGTQTTTERRILFNPEIPGSRVGEARSEWEIFVDLARRVDASRAHLMDFESGSAIRDEIARVVPSYAGVERLRDTGIRCSGAVSASAKARTARSSRRQTERRGSRLWPAGRRSRATVCG